MTVPPRIRSLLFWMVAMLAVLFVGCGNHSESEAPKPPGLRKKIAMPKKPVAQSVRPGEQGRVAKPSAARPGTEAKKKAAVPGKKPVEPEFPGKRGVAQPEKSESLMLAEGITKSPDYFYDPRGKHDPFESLFDTEAGLVGMAPSKEKVQKRRLPLTPLQMVSLGQLKLVAVVISPKGNKALVEEPSGKGYIISKGTYIGQNFGRVKRILNDRVIVEEEIEDFISGSTKIETTELELQKKVGDA